MGNNFCAKRILCLIFILLMICSLAGCYQTREKQYYADRGNYITEEAVVDNIVLDKETGCIYFWLSQIDAAYQDNTFKVDGESAVVLLENHLLDKVELGCKITYTSAPRYFGDGYCMPLVSLSCGGEELLSFEEGYENLLALY